MRPAIINSKITRVQPVFRWLEGNGGPPWPRRLLEIAAGAAPLSDCGELIRVYLEPEYKVPPTPMRLAWMIENVDRLVPTDGRQWEELRRRISDDQRVTNTLNRLRSGDSYGTLGALALEGATHADCLIECENAFIWIEGKRFDWLSPSIKWDVTRDQLARNIEAVWWLASRSDKEYRLIICHEHELKYHETLLLEGYRQGTWSGGLPHISTDIRRKFSVRIATLTWSQMATEWPSLRQLPELADVAFASKPRDA